MTVFLYVLFVFLGMASMGILLISNGAIHQCLAAVVLLASVACLIGAGICSRLDRIQRSLCPSLPPVSMAPVLNPAKPRPRLVAALLIGCGLMITIGLMGAGFLILR